MKLQSNFDTNYYSKRVSDMTLNEKTITRKKSELEEGYESKGILGKVHYKKAKARTRG